MLEGTLALSDSVCVDNTAKAYGSSAIFSRRRQQELSMFFQRIEKQKKLSSFPVKPFIDGLKQIIVMVTGILPEHDSP